MSVTEDEVRHVATLARLGLDESRIPTIAAELNGILAHMEVLSKVDTSIVGPVTGDGAAGTPLRVGSGTNNTLLFHAATADAGCTTGVGARCTNLSVRAQPVNAATANTRVNRDETPMA